MKTLPGVNEEMLENLVDQHDLAGVIDALANICYGKSQHLQCNWQDELSAKQWEKAGNKLNNLTRIIENLLS